MTLRIQGARWIINIAVSIADYKLPWFGRKLINQISMFFTLLALAFMALYLYFGYEGKALSIGTVIAVAVCSQLFLAKYMMVNELYPTAVRNLAVSAVSTMSRIGSMFSPQLFYLVSMNPSSVSIRFSRVTMPNGSRMQCFSPASSTTSSSSLYSCRRPKESTSRTICLQNTRESLESGHRRSVAL